MNLNELALERAAEFEERDGRVVLVRPPPRARGITAPFEWLSFWMAPRRLRLDELGSFCWRQIDGRTNADDIAVALRKRFGRDAEPAEQRVDQFVRMLKREELLRVSVSTPTERAR